MKKIIILISFALFFSTCETEGIFENKCNSKENIVEWYLADINRVVESYLYSNTDKEFPINSYYHLEILSSNTKNLDSLDFLLLEYQYPNTHKLEYINKWISWLQKHNCYSRTKANQIFEELNKKYGFKETDIREDQLRKLRKKYPQETYSKMALDSMIRSDFKKRNIRSRLGWYKNK